MKKIIIAFYVLMLTFTSVFAQEKLESIDSIYVQSDTAYAEVDYDFYYGGSKHYDGVVGYQFTVASDTVGKVALEGSYNGTDYVVVTYIDTVLIGNYSLYDADPEYMKYRVGMYGISGDTATLKNIIYYEKRTGR